MNGPDCCLVELSVLIDSKELIELLGLALDGSEIYSRFPEDLLSRRMYPSK